MMKYMPATRRLLLGQRSPWTANTRIFRPTLVSTASCSFSTAAVAEEESPKKPFERVMVANRGEIVQRVIRTCRQMDIETIAVYSTADAQAQFVKEADRAVCLGPAAANLSYLNTKAILQAITDTGAQAVHPGYGFLSENAAFSKTIVDHGAVWLGPSAYAIEKLGDKLESKHIAEDAGVSIVPGHDKPIESLEQALQFTNDGTVPYPVLLKAASGGGGKGMRICFNDQDLKEAWILSKAEAMQFFGDDRLLLEKFIEDPHHIEFQILATPTADGSTDVVVFPERECSIQRRNQKIIEESPSVLLTDETRRTMAEQAVKLCKAVGYESAGTIEFLVDKNQNFYFLEMNTRLQVEHCVTEEAVTNLDLVKAMLWIGAGWGFTEEIQEMRDGFMVPPMKHAMEARIYAEDPLRGFLPSTGPLLPYVEPTTSTDLRVDSGVVPGHVVTPFYDPMLSKVIGSGKTRDDAIYNLKKSMDEYVIEGVQHNARLIQAVLREDAFQKGDTPTSFLPTHFPDGFQGVELSVAEKENFAVAAVAILKARREYLQQPTLPGAPNGGAVVCRLGGFFGDPYKVQLNADGTSATVEKLIGGTGPRTVTLDEPVGLEPRRFLAQVSMDGVKNSIQVLNQDQTGETKMQMNGADTMVVVQSPREYELSAYMHEPEEVDTSSMVLSPMPGALISFAVEVGDEVMEGQELCVVEAMKMQNILRSERKGVISAINVNVGESLKADQVIMEFEA